MLSHLHVLLRLCAVACLLATSAWASEHHGQVTFNGLPVPGATVTAAQDSKKIVAITDLQGFYSFPDLADGIWKIEVEMFGFATARQDVTIASNAPAAKWELTLLLLDQIKAEIQRPRERTAQTAPPPAGKPAEPQEASASAAQGQNPENDELSQRAADGLLINGSVNNSAASPFGQAAAFGNNRFNFGKMYRFSVGFIGDNSALDARPFSLSGHETPKPGYSRATGTLNFGGPLWIPRLMKSPAMVFVSYQWTRNNSSTTQSVLVPTDAERHGIFSRPILDPLTGLPFAGDAIPQDRISPQAQALLKLYPAANVAGNPRYNFQIPIVSPTHQDAFQSRFNKTIGRSNQVFGGFAFQSLRSDSPSLFGFRDSSSILGMDSNVSWTRRLTTTLFLSLGYDFSRMAVRLKPYFQGRENISGEAGIAGNDQSPTNWGPPALVFAGGIAGLAEGQSAANRNQTSAVSYAMTWTHRSHNIAFGADYRRREFNYLSQQDPRGTFTFTGAVTGSDFADFLLGIPSTSSIAFGNPDKYLRQSLYDGYFADDFRINSKLTVNAGARWEYGSPITELHDRLVNLDVAPNFTAVSPVVASSPVGALTAQRYPNSLVRPDRRGFAPRIGLAWKPLPASTLVVRAGYGVYYDTSIYQTIAWQLAQQPPLSKTLSMQNTAANPLTLADGFNAPPSVTRNTFAIDPNFRVGYAQNWNLSVQKDLPGALQMTATYLGIKGTHAMQGFLPNTYPVGAANPCPACPAGFVFLASNGNSSRQAGQVQLRRRQRSGFGGSVQYTFSKAIDDAAALGGLPSSANTQSPGSGAASAVPRGLAIAQNWRDLQAERGLSTFDQRHLLSAQMQYTTGMGLGGGTLLGGWKGALFKDWTVATQLSAGSGLPQTPIYLLPVPGTGITGTLRPDSTGAPIYAAPSGLFLNPSAYTAPGPGQWGNVGRGSITGPAQFSMNSSLARAFRVKDHWNLDLRVDAANMLNHVTYSAWNATINSAQFGLPAAANAMRTLQTTLRLRY